MVNEFIARCKTEWEKRLEDLDRMYPNRHKQIHKVCCKNCPSEQDRIAGVEDPESKDIKEGYSKEVIASEFLFVCAWRQSKLCKGLCDYMGIDQQFLNDLHQNDLPKNDK